MSKPISVGMLHPLRFEERLLLVQAAIQQRIQDEQKANPNHLRARLWVTWIKKNILDVATQPGVKA